MIVFFFFLGDFSNVVSVIGDLYKIFFVVRIVSKIYFLYFFFLFGMCVLLIYILVRIGVV